jgi:4-hydroxy-3-polyprenylbenzoate decarboxylase
MGYRNLQEFITRLEQAGELVRIKEPVSPYLTITEITDRVCKAGGPALLFEEVVGFGMPVLMNAFGSMRRMCLALEVESLDSIAHDLLSFMEAEVVGCALRTKCCRKYKISFVVQYSNRYICCCVQRC